METRSIRPPSIPNDNDPVDHPPGTVGPPTAVPGDVGALEIIDEGPGTPRRPPPRAEPWSGWPAEWDTPNWFGRVEELTDIAWACIDRNASISATMPPYLVNAAPSLDAAWLANPDPDLYTSWEEFFKQAFWDFMLGEVFILTTARYDDGKGYPARFHVVPPWTVNAEMVGGVRRYTIGGVDVTADMLHVRYKSSVDDAHGHGPLEAGRTRIIQARLLAQYGASFAAGGGIPNAILTHPEELTAKQSIDLQDQWMNARLSRMGVPAVLSGGVAFETVQISPKDMSLVELSQMTEARICVMLGVPPFMMALPSGGDALTYSTVALTLDMHWRAYLRPQVTPLVAALSAWLTPRGTYLEVNRDSYVQPGLLERAQTQEIFHRIEDETGRVLTAAEIRDRERFSGGTPSLSQGVLK
jgi:HK97 family phage portal protein